MSVDARSPELAPLAARQRWLAPTVFVLSVAGVVFVALSAAACYTTTAAPLPLRFFDPRRSPTFDESWVVSVMDYALSSHENNDVVFLGDSACRTGIDPTALARLTGLRAYNLGIVGDLGPSVMLNVVQAYLLKHPAPRLVVFCVSPAALRGDVPEHWEGLRDHCVTCFGLDAPGLEAMEASWAYKVKQGTVIAWDQLFRKSDHDVRDKPLLGMKKETYRSFELSTRKWRGFVPLSGGYPIQRIVVEDGIVVVHPVWDAGVRRLAEACKQAQVPFMMCFAPISAEGSKYLNFEHVQHWRQALPASCPYIILAPHQELLQYPNELCWNSTHVNVQGAAKFTAQIAEDVRAALGAAGSAQPKSPAVRRPGA